MTVKPELHGNVISQVNMLKATLNISSRVRVHIKQDRFGPVGIRTLHVVVLLGI
jgi:hypothetical protein